jgi:hypothetical protein
MDEAMLEWRLGMELKFWVLHLLAVDIAQTTPLSLITDDVLIYIKGDDDVLS